MRCLRAGGVATPAMWRLCLTLVTQTLPSDANRRGMWAQVHAFERRARDDKNIKDEGGTVIVGSEMRLSRRSSSVPMTQYEFLFFWISCADRFELRRAPNVDEAPMHLYALPL